MIILRAILQQVREKTAQMLQPEQLQPIEALIPVHPQAEMQVQLQEIEIPALP